LISSDTRFDIDGLRVFADVRESHQVGLQEMLMKYFSDMADMANAVKDQYFCSALVVAAYIFVGIIQGGATVVYKPDAMSPGDMVRDPTFGTFLGYISRHDDYVLPEDDDFYDEIMDVELPG